MYSASLEQASCPFVAGARCETTLVVTCDVPFCFCIVPVLRSIWPCEAKTRHSEPAGAKGVHPVSSRLPYTELAYSVIHTSVGTHFAVLKKVEPTRICTLKALVVKTMRNMGRAGSSAKARDTSTGKPAVAGTRAAGVVEDAKPADTPKRTRNEQTSDTPYTGDTTENHDEEADSLQKDEPKLAKKPKSEPLMLFAQELTPSNIIEYSAQQLQKICISSLDVNTLELLLEAAQLHLDAASKDSRDADDAKSAYETSTMAMNEAIKASIGDVHARLTPEMEGNLVAYKGLMDNLVKAAAEGDEIQDKLLESADYLAICQQAMKLQADFDAFKARLKVIKSALGKKHIDAARRGNGSSGALDGTECSSQAVGASGQQQAASSLWRWMFGPAKSQATTAAAPAVSEVTVAMSGPAEI